MAKPHLHSDTGHDLHAVVPHPVQDGVDPVVLAVHDQLGHDDDVLGVHGPVGDPVLLGQGRGGVHNKLLQEMKNYQ